MQRANVTGSEAALLEEARVGITATHRTCPLSAREPSR